MNSRAQMLIPGEAEGPVLRLSAPLSFWGGIDPRDGRITLAGHPEQGRRITGHILVMPRLIGSSSSSAILLELIYNGTAPVALILGERDAILPVGAIVAGQMGWPTPPMALMDDPPFRTGQRLRLHRDGALREA